MMSSADEGADELHLQGLVVVFGAASLTTLGFLATNSATLRAHGDLGLQQLLLAFVVIGILFRVGQIALGVEPMAFDAFECAGVFLLWHAILLL
eukprot:CAMPEP_0196719090 /NCGR_PEP_ID=MMETSP1091-20130531/2155_1 /TAXON_ID=302021 /ORGANISM="Rhodomonas sp., Strain CCMP768" /LENGTH=93 /DNA_ID=CAMNT_0042059949 /DNA_START=88 /DNA_END=369 /DNA_ORIENTATION=+